MQEQITIALAGNPNCGKTTLFNEITGSNGYVGNWPGVTVEKKQASYKADKCVTIVDLPGIYSLSPYSPEEVVSRDYIVEGNPSAVINLMDATNIERSLYLATQILEAGCPVVLGLNMSDLLVARGDKIDAKKLSKMLGGVEVVEVSALKNKNLDTLVNKACEAGRAQKVTPAPALFSAEVEEALTEIEKLIGNASEPAHKRWYAIKVFERDAETIKKLNLSEGALAKAEDIIKKIEEARDDETESIITTERYEWIATVIDECVVRAPKTLTTSQKIDRVVTSRIFGLPIFIAIMIGVYYIAISTIGTAWTDWVNDNLFSEGFFLSGQNQYNEAKKEYKANYYQDQIDAFLATAQQDGVDTAGVADAVAAVKDGTATSEDEALIANFEKSASAAGVVATDVAVHDDDGNFVFTSGDPVTKEDSEGNPILASGEELETIASVDSAAFATAVDTTEPDPHDYGIFVDSIPTAATNGLEAIGASAFVVSLVVDGIIGGVGSVLGFIPQIFVLFVMLCFLEDCGYMSRVAFVMDRVFRRFGLSGKSFIPMIVSSGCGVPGVLATQTIESERDRRMTAMLTTMIPCSAKLPIIALVMGVLAGGSGMWWVAPMFYFMGIAAIIISAVMLKKTKPFAGEPVPFVMELPDYHFPSIRAWALHVWERVSAYIKKAGTIIFAAAVGIWLLSNFGVSGWDGGTDAFGFLPGMTDVPENFMDYSLLAGIGGALSWIFAPLGFGNWQATASTISALIAKENLVSTFGVLYGLGGANENSVSMWQGFAQMFTVAGTLHIGAMCAFVAFNMLCAPCFAAMGTIARQMNSARWTAFALIYECVFGWVVGLMINQFYELIVFDNFGFWTVVAFICAAAMLFQLFRPTPHFDVEKKVLSSLTADNA